jgi:hypothetical protein
LQKQKLKVKVFFLEALLLKLNKALSRINRQVRV